ncbi:MAG TPA: TaqI-like C-terminal specificity domain-containing protein [Crinalium sp.]
MLDWQLNEYLSRLDQREDAQKDASLPLIKTATGEWRLAQSERERLLMESIYGVDLDPGAVEVTRLALLFKLLEHGIEQPLRPLPDLSQNICRGNALIGPDFDFSWSKVKFSEVGVFDWEQTFPNVLQAGGFDVVIGNPPYIDSEWMMACLPDWRNYCTRRYRTAVGNWDIFCVFIEKAVQLCQEGGIVSFIVPNKLASADYAAKTRSLLIQSNQLLSIRDYSRVSVFSVAVYPLVFIAQKGKPHVHSNIQYEVMNGLEADTDEEGRSPFTSVSQSYSIDYSRCLASPEMPWSFSTPPQQVDLVNRLRQDFPLLGSLAQVTGAATVAEAYLMRSLIHNHPVPEDGDLCVVNSGTIDRYRWRWGEKPLRYLGNVYEYPVIPRSLTEHLPQTRYQQAIQAKIIVAGMSKTLECGLDQHGTILAAKSTSVIRSALDLRYLLGLLNSRLIQSYFKNSFEGNGLKGGYLRIGPPQLRQLPIRILNLDDPTEHQHHDHMIELVDQMLALQKQYNPLAPLPNANQLQNQISQLDLQIDQLVYCLYGLTNREIAAISP